MQRSWYAIIALLTLLVANFRGAQAQDTNANTTVPPIAGSNHSTSSRPTGTGGTSGSLIVVDASHKYIPSGTVVLGKEMTVPLVAVQGHPLLLEGTVRGDVLAVRSDVTIAPSARIGGTVVIIGGTVNNQAGEAVRVVQQDKSVLPALSGDFSVGVTQPLGENASPLSAPHVPHGDWLGGQLALLLFGLLCGFLAFVAAPHATNAAADRLVLDPARSALAGGVAAAGLFGIVMLNALLISSPLRSIWAPFGAVIALAAAGILAWGWVCGMRLVGEWVAKRVGRAPQGDSLYLRVAIGMSAFFFLNSFLGQIRTPLGVTGVGLEFAIAIVGLGGLALTRFGHRASNSAHLA